VSDSDEPGASTPPQAPALTLPLRGPIEPKAARDERVAKQKTDREAELLTAIDRTTTALRAHLNARPTGQEATVTAIASHDAKAAELRTSVEVARTAFVKATGRVAG